jgi:hypothetical protein
MDLAAGTQAQGLVFGVDRKITKPVASFYVPVGAAIGEVAIGDQ